MNPTTTVHESSTLFQAELSAFPQWVAWQYQSRAAGKPGKLPIAPATGRAADPKDPRTWDEFEAALQRQQQDDLAGLGFVLTAVDPYVVTDLDNCVDGAGIPSPWALGIVKHLDSYTEYSPSRTGLHIWTIATLPPGRRNAKPIEMYDEGHYMTVTFDPLPGTRQTVTARAAEVQQLHTIYLGRPTLPTPQPPTDTAPTIDDRDLVKRILRSKIGDRFALLWSGNTSGYPTASEADLALAGYLAFWTQDAAQLDRIFRMSGLYRPGKWDAKRGDFTYGKMTVRRAIDNRAGTYDPRYRRA